MKPRIFFILIKDKISKEEPAPIKVKENKTRIKITEFYK